MVFTALDLEGVLIPEIWPSAAAEFKINELYLTTREEKDYDKLMGMRIKALKNNGITFEKFKKVLSGITPFEGAVDFLRKLRSLSTTAIVSDTFLEFFNGGISANLGDPMIFCHHLSFDSDGFISGYKLRMKNAKRETVLALQHMCYKVFAFGDSYNDIDMIKNAEDGMLFRPPENIKKDYPEIPFTDSYDVLFEKIKDFTVNAYE